jgi:hypothetical protein
VHWAVLLIHAIGSCLVSTASSSGIEMRDGSNCQRLHMRSWDTMTWMGSVCPASIALQVVGASLHQFPQRKI